MGSQASKSLRPFYHGKKKDYARPRTHEVPARRATEESQDRIIRAAWRGSTCEPSRDSCPDVVQLRDRRDRPCRGDSTLHQRDSCGTEMAAQRSGGKIWH